MNNNLIKSTSLKGTSLKATPIKRAVVAAMLAAAMSQPALAQTAETESQDDNSGTYWGVGIGTAIGAIVGGPVGAAAGAALGGSFGFGHDQSSALEETESRLDDQTIALSQREGELKNSKRAVGMLKAKNATLTREHALQASALADLKAQDITEREQAEIMSGIAKHYSQEVYYRHNESSIPDYAKSRIDELAGFMTEHPNVSIALHGHTDLLGQQDANLALAQARIDALRDYLVDQGISDSRIDTQAHGESFATVTVGDAGNYVLDRRVSIELAVPSTAPQPVVMHAGGR